MIMLLIQVSVSSFPVPSSFIHHSGIPYTVIISIRAFCIRNILDEAHISAK